MNNETLIAAAHKVYLQLKAMVPAGCEFCGEDEEISGKDFFIARALHCRKPYIF